MPSLETICFAIPYETMLFIIL